jgi:hypothetical protein
VTNNVTASRRVRVYTFSSFVFSPCSFMPAHHVCVLFARLFACPTGQLEALRPHQRASDASARGKQQRSRAGAAGAANVHASTLSTILLPNNHTLFLQDSASASPWPTRACACLVCDAPLWAWPLGLLVGTLACSNSPSDLIDTFLHARASTCALNCFDHVHTPTTPSPTSTTGRLRDLRWGRWAPPCNGPGVFVVSVVRTEAGEHKAGGEISLPG